MGKKTPLIQLENVTKYYTGEGGIGLGIHQINTKFDLGEFVLITGASGSGKTTLLNVISGMDSYEEGVLWIDGEDSTSYGSEEYENYRRKYISFIFQNYNLVDSFTVFQNVELALIAKGISKVERKSIVLDILKKVGLEKRINHKVTRLSGGEKQRVAIARALATDAPIIACDEITGNLDYKTSIEIIALLRKISKGKLVLLVTHDPDEVLKYVTRVIEMHDGSINKDYQNTTETTSESFSIEKFNERKIKKFEVYKLGLKTILSTPKKFIFMILFFFIASLIITFVYSIYNQIDNLSNESNNFTIFNNNYNERIIVKKQDDLPFSEIDFNDIKNIKNVKNLIKEDILLDKNICFKNKDEIEYIYLRSINDLNNSDLSKGVISNSETDVVLSSYDKKDLDLVNEKSEFLFDGISNKILLLNIVGVSIDSNATNKYLYVNDELLNKMYKYCVLSSSNFEIKDFDLSQIIYNPLIIIDDSLEKNVFNVATDYLPFEEVVCDLTISNIYNEFTVSNALLNMKLIDYKDYSFDYNSLENRASFYNTISCSKETFDSININGYYQISITVDKIQHIDNITKELNEKGYITYQVYSDVTNNVSSLSFIMILVKVYIIIYLILMFIGLSALMYVILRNVVRSEHKAFLVMRSLGIDGKNIKVQLYSQLLSIAAISYIFVIIFKIIMSTRNYGYMSLLMSGLNIVNLLLIGILIFIIALLLGFKYSNNLISKAIVAKEME